MSTDVVSVRVGGELKARLEELSRRTGRPAGYYVKLALEEHLEHLEWAYGVAQLAEDVRAGKEPTVAFDDLLAEAGLSSTELD